MGRFQRDGDFVPAGGGGRALGPPGTAVVGPTRRHYAALGSAGARDLNGFAPRRFADDAGAAVLLRERVGRKRRKRERGGFSVGGLELDTHGGSSPFAIGLGDEPDAAQIAALQKG